MCLYTFATLVNNWLSFSPLLKQYNIGHVGLLFKPQQRETSQHQFTNKCVYYQGSLGRSDHTNPNCCHPINMVHTDLPSKTFVGKHIDV